MTKPSALVNGENYISRNATTRMQDQFKSKPSDVPPVSIRKRPSLREDNIEYILVGKNENSYLVIKTLQLN